VPLAWSSTGSFSSSQIADSPAVTGTYTRTLPLFTVPPGAYGSLPVLVFLQAGKSPNIAQHQTFSANYSFGSTQTPGVGVPTGKNIGSRFGIYGLLAGIGDVNPAFAPRYFVPHSGFNNSEDPPLWDSGITVSINSTANSIYELRGRFASTIGLPTVVGTNSFLTQDVHTGSLVAGVPLSGSQISTIIAIADDTHATFNQPANLTFASLLGTTNSLEEIPWIAALITLPYTRVTRPFPTDQTSIGTLSIVSTSFSTPDFAPRPQLLNSGGVGPTPNILTGSSLDTSFGPLITDAIATFGPPQRNYTFDEILLADSACVDAMAVVQGYTFETPPFSIDLANGNPNWQMIGSSYTTGLNGQLSTFQALAHWTRPEFDPASASGYDTSLKWTGIPVTPSYSALGTQPFPDNCTGACDIWMWPSVFPDSASTRGNNRGYVIA
jgi:hypothetical protein